MTTDKIIARNVEFRIVGD